MEVIIRGEANEIAALLLELEGRQKKPFIGECQGSATEDENVEPAMCRPDGI
ncbi:hypothetical protein TAMA11512_13110 [Selenomonas sp. TAMA-11512]|uniref:hypothetical protein n=1 Tax=Selenomonas sp. TAMA-11512 TaxID=3095337 RepID=UPI0030937BFF|nr:hypothetical protein TAMA11512_13110 [Selenomonas sp. TAMA-11512]